MLQQEVALDEAGGEPVAELDRLGDMEFRVARGDVADHAVLGLKDHGVMRVPHRLRRALLGMAVGLEQPDAAVEIVGIDEADVLAPCRPDTVVSRRPDVTVTYLVNE